MSLFTRRAPKLALSNQVYVGPTPYANPGYLACTARGDPGLILRLVHWLRSWLA